MTLLKSSSASNKKIRNATLKEYAGIKFKSQLEVLIYKTLTELGYNPKYEERTFEFVHRYRPTVPFYNRVKKEFTLDMKPLQPITYTPDFTFEYNGVLIIIEAKGFENDVFPVKRNLFRRHLESLGVPAIFFEIRTKKELLRAIDIILMETPTIRAIRSLIPYLPEKDIPIGNKLLEGRKWEELDELVNSAITKIEKSLSKEETKYQDIKLDKLYELQNEITYCTI